MAVATAKKKPAGAGAAAKAKPAASKAAAANGTETGGGAGGTEMCHIVVRCGGKIVHTTKCARGEVPKFWRKLPGILEGLEGKWMMSIQGGTETS